MTQMIQTPAYLRSQPQHNNYQIMDQVQFAQSICIISYCEYIVNLIKLLLLMIY